MRRSVSVALGLSAAFAVAAGNAHGTTYHVASGGSDANPGTQAAPFATIQKAANTAVAGDVIEVGPGTYAGARFSRSGTSAAPIGVRGQAGAIVSSPGPSNTNRDNLWVFFASWITIEGFEVTGAGRAGIAVQASETSESHGVVLRRNHCHHNSRWGIFTGYAEGILIEDNVTSYSAIEHGIYVSNTSDNPVIRRNVAHHNNASGIQINADPALPGDGIISNAVVEANTAYENGLAGGAAINLASVTFSRIVNNVLYDNHATGIAGWDDGFSISFGTHDNLIACNTILQAAPTPSGQRSRFAVSLLNGSSRNRLVGNVLHHPSAPSKGSIDIDSSSLAGLDSDYNVVVSLFAVDETFIGLSAWQALGQDLHSIVASPSALFVDAANHDLHLRAGSPAIDRGTSVAGVTTDRDGAARPQGLAFDIGAYELGGAAPPPAPADLVLGAATLPGGQVGAPYSSALAASGGAPPYLWSVVAGDLPPGLALGASTGLLAGTPSAQGSFVFTVQVTDAQAQADSAQRAFTVAIAAAPPAPADLVLSTATLPGGQVGTSYSGTLAASGGVAPYRWSVVVGSLPPGLALGGSNGVLAGTPTIAGSFSFAIQVADSQSPADTAQRVFTVAIAAPPPPAPADLVLSTASLPGGKVGTAYSSALAASGGVAPYRGSVVAGSLPPGLALNASTGVLAGTPTAAGSFGFAIQVADAQSPADTAQRTFSVAIAGSTVAPLDITTASLPRARLWRAYSQTLQAIGGVEPYRWSIVSGSLPPGLALDASSGAISGWASRKGTWKFTVQVTDAQSPARSDRQGLSIRVVR